MSIQQSVFSGLEMSELSDVKHSAATISAAAYAITACSKLLSAFLLDDDTVNQIPESLKNSFIRGGLVDAVIIAANQLAEAGEYLEDQASAAEDQKSLEVTQ